MADKPPSDQAHDGDDRVAVAKSISDMLEPMVVQTAEATSELTKWLLASLLAVNGGAIALMADHLSGGALSVMAAGSWLLGVVAAIVSGLLAYRNGIEGQRVLGEVLTRLYAVRMTGRLDLEFEKEGAALQRKGRTTLYAGIASLLFFVAGAFAMALNLIAT